MRSRRRPFALLTVAAALVLGACAGEVPVRTVGPEGPTTTFVEETTGEQAPPPTAVAAADLLPAGEDATVEEVVDGDTIVVAGGTRVRLIGVDTPETKDPRTAVQCFGAQAHAFTAGLLPEGTAVRLVHDVERRDRYQRTLAYVYRASDGLFVNATLVAEGYAQAATYPPNVAHAEELTALARAAREEGRGLWSACGDEASTAPPVTPGPAAGACDPSYPGVCIPPAPPDLDCGDVADRRFPVMPPDPHRFDGNGDGVGCES